MSDYRINTMGDFDPNLPANQEARLQDSFNPSDYAMNETESAGPVNIAYDRAQQDQMVDGPEVPPTVKLKPPPGSYTGHVDISEDESQYNTLDGKRYSMREEPK